MLKPICSAVCLTELIPRTYPSVPLKIGPPLFPGDIGAVIWYKLS
ncbi:hypothetical protein [Bacillus sp. E(2018)]|nr:hypothetical protein [Bacillus sp. E(2018)]